MVRESEPGKFRCQGIYWGRRQGRGRVYFNNRSSSNSYKQEEVKFVTISSKQVYIYMGVKNIIIQRLQRTYGYEVKIPLRDIEEYDM